MPSTIRLDFNSSLTVVQTFTGEGISAGDATVTTSGLNEVSSLTASTSVPVTKHASFQKTLSSGTGTIDLTALPGITADETVTFSTLKVQAIKLRGKSTNANVIVVSNGASNGYRIDGTTTAWSIPIAPGQTVLLNLNEAGDDVSGTRKDIDLAGVGSQILEVHLVAG